MAIDYEEFQISKKILKMEPTMGKTSNNKKSLKKLFIYFKWMYFKINSLKVLHIK